MKIIYCCNKQQELGRVGRALSSFIASKATQLYERNCNYIFVYRGPLPGDSKRTLIGLRITKIYIGLWNVE